MGREMNNKEIFREAALERLSSPEQLDRLMLVTSPRGWLALGAACLVILSVLIWSLVGRIPVTIAGEGILIGSEGLYEVEVLGSGVVAQLLVEVGDLIERGEVIALIDQPLLQQRIDQARDRLSFLGQERRRRAQNVSENVDLEVQSLERERLALERRSGAARERVDWLTQRLEAEREALELGLLSPEAIQNTVQLLEAARAEVESIDLQLQGNEMARQRASSRETDELISLDSQIREATQELGALELELEQSSRVVNPYDGYVQEIRVDEGQLIAAGQAIASLLKVDAPLQAVVFVSNEGKRIQPGMRALVSPTTVKREEHGWLVGEVKAISGQPATPGGMMRVLRNEILVQQLTLRGAPFMVEVALERTDDTFSGFRWTSPGGPQLSIEGGTLCSVQVIVDERRPISLVIPLFRSSLGLPA